jgi:hypothetical protein
MDYLKTGYNMGMEKVDCTPYYQQVRFDSLKIDRRELYLLTGYGDGVPDRPFVDMIDGMIDELAGCCTPEYGYVIHPGRQIDHEHLLIDETVLQPGKIITASLREAEYFAVFVTTVGQGFDQWNRASQPEDDMVRAFFADSLGSVLAEACAKVMLERLEREMMTQGLFVSNSYSPGYCDWKLMEQRKLFAFFPEQFCGVTLTDSCLMLPIKSVSGIVGIGKGVKKRLYSCEVCTMENCVKNRKKGATDLI